MRTVSWIIGAIIGCALWLFWIYKWVDHWAWHVLCFFMIFNIIVGTYRNIRRQPNASID